MSAPLQARGHDDDDAAAAAPAATTNDAFDVEAAAPEAEAEAKRVSKNVGTVSVFAASASLAMFLSFPGDGDRRRAPPRVMYGVGLASVCVSLLASLLLLMHSVVVRYGTPGAARARKTAMVASLAFVLVSFVLRVWVMLMAAPP